MYIPSFEYAHDGIPGVVDIYNGSIETNDVGVVYYEFTPYRNMEKEYAFAMEPEREPNKATTLDIICGAALLLLAIASPIPGDEAVAFATFITLIQ